MVKAVYLHIPFCEHICYYCDFNKVFLQNQPVEEYLRSLELEVKHSLEAFPTGQIDTIFVGGGTPTSLNMKQMEQFLVMIHERLLPLASADAEVTFEANPGGLPREKLQLMKDFGVNRLSFGVQTFNDELLKKIGRTHRAKDVFETLETARKVGFDNINVDLIYALPEQTVDAFRDTLQTAFSLEVEHFSGYSLQIEPKTVFYNLMKKGKLRVPKEEHEAEMFELLMTEMEKHGYHQYEISNFALSGLESKHNLTYWNNDEYFGFGAGAHSYVANARRVNAGPLNHYMKRIEETGFPYIEEHQVTLEERMEEEMFLGLRKREGVSKKQFFDRYGKQVKDVFGSQLEAAIHKGLLEETGDTLRLTKQGFFLGNEVFQSFLGDV